MSEIAEKPDHTASEPKPSDEENKPKKSLRQKLEEAGIEVLTSEDPTRECSPRNHCVLAGSRCLRDAVKLLWNHYSPVRGTDASWAGLRDRFRRPDTEGVGTDRFGHFAGLTGIDGLPHKQYRQALKKGLGHTHK